MVYGAKPRNDLLRVLEGGEALQCRLGILPFSRRNAPRSVIYFVSIGEPIMPVRFQYLKKFNLAYVKAYEPFSFPQLAEVALKRSPEEWPDPQLSCPRLFDFRDVDLMGRRTPEIRRTLREHNKMDHLPRDVPAAMVARDESAYGVLRMYSAYAEIEGVRTADNSFCTTDLEEAIEWLLMRGGIKGSPSTYRIMRHVA